MYETRKKASAKLISYVPSFYDHGGKHNIELTTAAHAAEK